MPGHASGISIDYLFELSGCTDYVKVDRHISHFVAEALPSSRDLSKEETIDIIRKAAALLSDKYPDLTPRKLDYIIWHHMRGDDALHIQANKYK